MSRDSNKPEPPTIVARDAWVAAREQLLAEEKAHTQAGDALAAARRRLPMTLMDPATLIGSNGPVSLQQVFAGRRMLIVYHFMWKNGLPHTNSVKVAHTARLP